MSPSTLAMMLGAGWLLVGIGVGGLLLRQGQPTSAAAAAVLAWPAMVSLLGAESMDAPGAGPFAVKITAAFAALRAALAEPALGGVVELNSLQGIERSLRRADARLAAVDRLLEDPVVASDAGSVRLITARAHAADEVEAVLRQLLAVRVQLGLVALAGDTSAVRAHLGELAARAQALEEVTC
ncbi:hypothetical protein LBMAG42_17730 [Deltaproteobacteria bacterium]|nr:hypothetical protein LBMAG42_17730 [Deltaproteobacteria bacterium]